GCSFKKIALTETNPSSGAVINHGQRSDRKVDEEELEAENSQ
ncbi:hypothetical protein Trydic_g23193, partial [Trypoxylus dichotomus]